MWLLKQVHCFGKVGKVKWKHYPKKLRCKYNEYDQYDNRNKEVQPILSGRFCCFHLFEVLAKLRGDILLPNILFSRFHDVYCFTDKAPGKPGRAIEMDTRAAKCDTDERNATQQ